MHVYYIHFKGFRISFIGGIFCSLLVYNDTRSLCILCHPTEQLSKISPIGAWCAKSKLVKKEFTTIEVGGLRQESRVDR